MAGGKGTRIAAMNSEVPKPMIPLLGKPVLEHQINCLHRQGCTDITLVTGYLGHIIKEYFGDGSSFGVNISYIDETNPLGTAGALFYLKRLVKDDFLLLNGDIIFDVDISRFLNYHKSRGGLVTLFSHPNDHPFDSAIVVYGDDGIVTDWLHKEEKHGFYQNRVNAGLHMVSPKLLVKFDEAKKTDLDREILKPLIKDKMLYAYSSSEYVKDMGTPFRFHEVESDILNGIVQKKNYSHPQKAVFLDRDGTINKYVGFLRNINDFVLIDGVSEFIRFINRSGYLAIVATNQPVIARGEVTWEYLDEIHRKMETLLGERGAYIDDVFICPHHPDKGFEGECPEYKIECSCRKPKPGLLFLAAEKYNIDLTQSFMVGDSESDLEAGRAAGCRSVLFREKNPPFSAIKEWIKANY